MEDYRVTQTGDEIQEIFNQSPVDTSDISELKEAATSLDGRLEAVEGKIPSGASEENPLADKQYVDDSIASASATFRGTYNEVTDLELTTEATHAEIGEALASVIDTADSNDYCFVQIPTADATPTEIESIERYKFVTGTGWQYEYTLNNSGFTADQWAAINSGITSGFVAKLADLPTNAELENLLNGKANAADVYTKSETYNKTELDAQLGEKANSADVYPKTDTYTKQEVNALITTPEVQYVTVTATAGTTAVTDVLPATGAANTIYRVGSWDGTQYDDGVYSEYSWNGSAYILLDVKNYGFATGSDFDNPTTAQRELVTTVGSVLDGISEGVFDLTAKTGDSYATLADALTAANTSIPTNKKKGGMSIKFVQSSDNKYVQCFLTKNEWSASEADWMEYAPQDKLIELVGIAPGGATSNVTQVGDIYYNTTTRLLRRCIKWHTSASDSLYETVPFYKGAVYIYQGHIYVYDGKTIVADNADIPAIIQDAIYKDLNHSIPLASLDNYKNGTVPNIIRSVVGQDVIFTQITSPALTKIIDVSGAMIIQYPTFLSSSGLGSCFVDSEHHFISGYAEKVQPIGTLITLDVPTNARYFYIGLNSVLVNSIDNYNVVKDGISIGLEELKEQLYDKVDLIDTLASGYYNLAVSIGNTVDTSHRTSSTSTSSTIVNCKAGDIFLVGGFGGESSRLWGFVDKYDKLLSVAPSAQHTLTPYFINAPVGSNKLIYNTVLKFADSYPSYLVQHGDITYLKNMIDELTSEDNILNFNIKINDDSYYDDGLMLLAMKTNVPNNQIPFNLGYLFCKWNDNKTLYYGMNLNNLKKIKFPDSLNNKVLKYAISPKDGRIIMTVRNTRDSLYVWDSVNMVLMTLDFNSAPQKPMGWLYNSGCCFDIDDNNNEICLFAEYSQSPGNSGGFNIWRGIYPYTEESMWSVVMHIPYVGDDPSGITHFHQVRRDPWTGIIYATSGDASVESKWWYSTDHGITFTLLTTGQTSGFEDHICRIINFIFTEDKVYFATDHGTNHCLNSIERISQTGILDITTRQKIVDLPNGQATNFLCYSEFPKGIFMYDRWDVGYTPLSPIKVQFYSLETQALIDIAELAISDTWGGHRGGCYVDYLSTTMETPAIGFDSNSPCIFKLSNPNVAKIGTIFYDILGKVVHTI